jgi:hypothetical protein
MVSTSNSTVSGSHKSIVDQMHKVKTTRIGSATPQTHLIRTLYGAISMYPHL